MSNPTRMVVHMIGNAHLDPMSMWPWPEGVDEALVTPDAYSLFHSTGIEQRPLS